MSDVSVLHRVLNRERRARKQAEILLEDMSRQLYYANEELRSTAGALRDESMRTFAILQTAAEGIISFRSDGTIETVNPAAERIFGYEVLELLGEDIKSLLSSDDDENIADQLDDDFWTVAPLEIGKSRKACGRRRDGTTFKMELAGSRVKLGDRMFYTWIVRDVTQRHMLEQQLAFAQKMESVGQLAAGVAHEINTPIQYVGDNTSFLDEAFADLSSLLELYDQLFDKCQQGDETDALCDSIESKVGEIDLPFLRDEIPSAIQQSAEGTSRVAKIVRAMKEFSHPGSHEKTAIDLNKAIESTVTVSRNEWKYVAELETDLDPSLPKITCLPGELNQAILNLIINASHAIADQVEGDSKGKIAISTRYDEDHVELRVADSGTGMTEQVREKIFEPFFTTKEVGKGTGQGLSIVYSVVVEKHAGTIDVESELGQGTTFIIRLPRFPADET